MEGICEKVTLYNADAYLNVEIFVYVTSSFSKENVVFTYSRSRIIIIRFVFVCTQYDVGGLGVVDGFNH